MKPANVCIFVETRFPHVAKAGLNRLGSGDPPAVGLPKCGDDRHQLLLLLIIIIIICPLFLIACLPKSFTAVSDWLV